MAIALFSAGQPVSGNGLVNQGMLLSLALAERAVSLALADVADVFDSPIFNVQDGTGTGSLVQRYRQMSLGWALPMNATAAENTDVAASSVDVDNGDVTIARRALRLDQTNLALAIGGAQGFDPIGLGMTMTGSFRAGRVRLAHAAAAAGANTVTGTGVGDVDDLFAVLDDFTSSLGSVPGMIWGQLHPTAMQAIRNSLRSEAGPLAQRADVQAFLAVGFEQLFQFMLQSSTRVNTASSVHKNWFALPGALGYSIASANRLQGMGGVVSMPTDLPMRIDVEYSAGTDAYKIVANAYDGVGIVDEARLRVLETDEA
jgi:hypothetical protein